MEFIYIILCHLLCVYLVDEEPCVGISSLSAVLCITLVLYHNAIIFTHRKDYGDQVTLVIPLIT